VRAIEVTSWRSVAEFAGATHACRWEQGTLQIATLSSEEAERLLRILGSLAELERRGTQDSRQFTLDGVVRDADTPHAHAQVLKRVREDLSIVYKNANRESTVRSMLDLMAEYIDRVIEAAPVDSEVAASGGQQDRESNASSSTAAATTEPMSGAEELASALAAAASAVVASGDIVDDVIRSSQTLREVICRWVDRGITTKHELLVTAEKYKNDIPVLKRTRDVRGRVLAALKSIHLPGAA